MTVSESAFSSSWPFLRRYLLKPPSSPYLPHVFATFILRCRSILLSSR
jgi:hypothetical protein